MGGGRRRLTRADLEAMRQEFDVGLYHGRSHGLDDDLRQVRRAARLGMDLAAWARARGVPMTYARALRRYLDQG